MTDDGSGLELLNQVRGRLRIRIPTANVIGAVLATASAALTSANTGRLAFPRVDLITVCVYLLIGVVVGIWRFKQVVMKAAAWLVEERPPTEAEQRRTLALPWSFAFGSMLGWVGAAVIFAVLTGFSNDGAAVTVRVALSILLGGLTTCGLTYLLVEWTMRPVAARALADHVPERPVVPGVRTKLLLSWAVGSDVFLLMIGLSFVGRPANSPPSPAAIWFIVSAGLVAGSLVLYVATRSLVSPLLELRQAIGRVQRGDIDVKLAVNDGGELGLLQAGFNQMVLGLRERRTLQDLFGRHVGEEVARQALEQGAVALGGERREVGVIFVDVIGSTGLAQSRPPEAVVELLNRFFATVVRVVAAEGGWVNKFEGDGALCVFGAPASSDDYAVHTLRAARTLRRELLALTAVNPELDAAIGVSAGTVVAGNIGDQQRYEYTIIGTPVNEAARLTDEAKHRLGRVLASEEAVTRAGSEARSWLVTDELRLRGIGEPVLVYEPTGSVEVNQSAI